MHKCPQCGRPTDGQYSDGGEFEDICDDCYLLGFLNGQLMTEEEITEREAMHPSRPGGTGL